MTPPGRVLIAHPDPRARTYLRGLAERELRLVGPAEADSFDMLLARLREVPGIDLVIVDLDLPGMNWEVGLRYLADNHHGVRVAVLSSNLGPDALEILAANGTALVPKQLPEASLVETLGRILDRPEDLPGATAGAMADHQPGALFAALDHRLTGRQRDVLRLLSQGHSNLEIAQLLGIAEGTVKVHVNAAFRTLGVHNRVSAAVAFRDYFEVR